MSDENTIVTVEPQELSLGALPIASPTQIVERASQIAGVLADLVEQKKLYSNIQGRRYVKVEGWTTLGAMLGVVPREVSCIHHETGEYEALVELVRVSDGQVIGRGSALMGIDEWQNRPEFARRSMSITRATGKAFRLSFSWIMTLAGYEPTPAEEMTTEVEDGNGKPAPAKAAPKVQASRPWGPEMLRAKLLISIRKHQDDDPNSAGTIGEDAAKKIAIVTKNILGGIADANDKRHMLYSFLFGVESAKQLTHAERDVLESWLISDAPMAREEVALVMDFLSSQDKPTAQEQEYIEQADLLGAEL